jgi:hypothetical protein
MLGRDQELRALLQHLAQHLTRSDAARQVRFGIKKLRTLATNGSGNRGRFSEE